MSTPAKTRTELVYERLRADILRGAIAPGSAMPFARLKDDYGASMGVLREALMRLTAEGLAVNQAQHGFRVVGLSLEDLEDLTSTRCMIEAMALRDSIEHGDLRWESTLVAALHCLENTPKADGANRVTVSAAWAEAHHEFHMALLAGARSKRMLGIVAALRASAEVYRRWSIPFERTARDVSAEHRDLVRLALARDARGAAAAMQSHLKLTSRLITDGVGDTEDSQPKRARVRSRKEPTFE